MYKFFAIWFVLIVIVSCNSSKEKITVDTSKHKGLSELKNDNSFCVLYSDGYIDEAKKQAKLIEEAYLFLSGIMQSKDDFCLLVISEDDWKNNAYSPIPGMPEYYKGNLIVGAGHNSMAAEYEGMVRSLPKEITKELIATYTNDKDELDMKLFFDKLSIHELTHSFQDPKNSDSYSMSRWLEELHANMGLYAFYKTKRPNELKYILDLVNFSLNNPPPDLKYKSLSDFNTYYYEMSPSDYGFYQMKFTKTAEVLIDSLGNAILKPLNDFIIKYDESWKEKLTEKEFSERLTNEVHPYITEVLNNWAN